ncbi:MAG: ABC transporter ATP-binding protein [Chloroflexi bacterium]|nr:ABC transporter ATP-binding protein [Chloroflexota bacterium]
MTEPEHAATTTEPATTLAVEMRGIVKRFPGLVANDHVDFDLRRGEVHALLGENGAGKSTLMNILSGLYGADAGTISVQGVPTTIRSPRDAITAGLGMIHQHFTLVPSLTVTENVLLGLSEPRFRLHLPLYAERIAKLAEDSGLRVDPTAKVWQLSVGEQQRVEIIKMLYRGARVLIMDEPTAVLAPQEAEELFRTLRDMTARGESIVFISHKLDEVLAIADRITILRKGKVTAAGMGAAGRTRRELAQLMIGREVLETIERTPSTPGPVVLSLSGVNAVDERGLPALQDVSLDIRAGEIMGLAGVAGNGQSELAEVITGLRGCTGRVTVHGEELAGRPPLRAIDAGVAHIPEDRIGTGSAPDLSLVDNLIMKSYRRAPIARGWIVNSSAARDRATELKHEYQVAAPTIDTQARLLSGGNLQRLIFAREVSTMPSIIIAAQPSRGLDVGAVETVHRLLLERRTAGAAVLLISEDLDEILALSDRVAVIYEGHIAGVLDAVGADIHTLGLLMTGGGE